MCFAAWSVVADVYFRLVGDPGWSLSARWSGAVVTNEEALEALIKCFVSITMLWFAFAFHARRLHDFGRSGAWALFAPVVFFSFYCGLRRGDAESNAFGPRTR
jgi:uncharacterized membrane protein YhaH (DUF805 family)